MRRNFSPASQQFNERGIVREYKTFRGMYEDIPEPPIGGMRLLENYIAFDKRLEPRSGTRKWSSVKRPAFLSGATMFKYPDPVPEGGFEISGAPGTFYNDEWAGKYMVAVRPGTLLYITSPEYENMFVVWPDGSRENILGVGEYAYDDENVDKVLFVSESDAQSSTDSAEIWAPFNGWCFHQNRNRIVMQFGCDFYVADKSFSFCNRVMSRSNPVGVSSLYSREITRWNLNGIAPANEHSRFAILDDSVLAYNRNGIFSIDLNRYGNEDTAVGAAAATNFYTYHYVNVPINTVSQITEQPKTSTKPYGYRYFYTLTELTHPTLDTGVDWNRVARNVRIISETAPVQPAGSTKDYSEVWTAKPVGDATVLRAEWVRTNALPASFDTLAEIKLIADGQFKITADSVQNNISVNWTGSTTWDDAANKLTAALQEHYTDLYAEYDRTYNTLKIINPAEGGRITAIASGDGGTDISSMFVGGAGDGAETTPAIYETPSLVIPNISAAPDQYTHVSIYRTLDIGENGIDSVTGQGNNKELFIWVNDYPITKVIELSGDFTPEDGVTTGASGYSPSGLPYNVKIDTGGTVGSDSVLIPAIEEASSVTTDLPITEGIEYEVLLKLRSVWNINGTRRIMDADGLVDIIDSIGADSERLSEQYRFLITLNDGIVTSVPDESNPTDVQGIFSYNADPVTWTGATPNVAVPGMNITGILKSDLAFVFTVVDGVLKITTPALSEVGVNVGGSIVSTNIAFDESSTPDVNGNGWQCLSVGDVGLAIYANVTVNRAASGSFDYTDCGNRIFDATANYFAVIQDTSGTTTYALMNSPYDGELNFYRNNAALASPSGTESFDDDIKDDDLRPRIAELSCKNRLWLPLPRYMPAYENNYSPQLDVTAPEYQGCGCVGLGFMLSSYRNERTIYYSQVAPGYEFFAGYGNAARQVIRLDDSIQWMLFMIDSAVVFCRHSIWQIPLNNYSDVTYEDLGLSTAVLSSQQEVSRDIGCLDYGSIKQTSSTSAIFKASDGTIRLMQYTGNGITISDSLSKDQVHNRISALTGISAVSFDAHNGFMLWGRKTTGALNQSFRMATDETNGIGWALNAGSAWIIPEPGCENITVFDDYGRQAVLVLDKDGYIYDLSGQISTSTGITKIRKDKTGTDGTAGTAIQPRFKLPEDVGTFEHYWQTHEESHIYFRPIDEALRSTSGYTSAGYPTTMEVDVTLYKDGNPTNYSAQAKDIQITGDIFFDRLIRAHRLQLEIEVNNGEHIIVGTQQYYKSADQPSENSTLVSTEQEHQAALAAASARLGFSGVTAVNLQNGADAEATGMTLTDDPTGATARAIATSSADSVLASGDLSGNFTVMLAVNSVANNDIIATGDEVTIKFTEAAGVYSINFNDGTNDETIALTWDGSNWLFLAIVRSGSTLSVYEAY